jgi:hypothetical protein
MELVWYADVLEPKFPPGCTHHETHKRSQEMFAKRFSFDPYWDSARKWTLAIVSAVPIVDRALAELVVADVYTYLSDLQRRCEARGRFLRALVSVTNQNRPVIVVAHSLGSLIVYDYLQDSFTPAGFTPFRIARFVTMGSMLSVPEVYRAIFGAFVKPPLPVPPQILEWVNVRDKLDPLAFSMAPAIADRLGKMQIVETRTAGVKNPFRAHDARNYLSDSGTARAVAWAWCQAWPGGIAAAPAGCADVKIDVPRQ